MIQEMKDILLKENRNNLSQEEQEKVIKQYKGLIGATLRRVHFSPSDRLDAYQEGLIILLQATKTYNPEKSDFSTYATNLLYWNLIQYSLKNKSNTSSLLENDEEVPQEEDAQEDSSEEIPYIQKALELISSQSRDYLIQRFFEGKTQQEIADVAGIAQKNACKREQKALKELKQVFQKGLK